MINLYIQWGYTFFSVPLERNAMHHVTSFGMHMFPSLDMLGFMFFVNKHMSFHNPLSSLHVGGLTLCILTNVIIVNPIQTNFVSQVAI